jgi:hypothetical protein
VVHAFGFDWVIGEGLIEKVLPKTTAENSFERGLSPPGIESLYPERFHHGQRMLQHPPDSEKVEHWIERTRLKDEITTSFRKSFRGHAARGDAQSENIPEDAECDFTRITPKSSDRGSTSQFPLSLYSDQSSIFSNSAIQNKGMGCPPQILGLIRIGSQRAPSCADARDVS